MKRNKMASTSINSNNSYVAETLEEKVTRIMSNKEPIKDSAPMVYTDRKEGVRPDTDIRTDRWDVATEAMDAASKSRVAKREGKPKDIGTEAAEGMKAEGDGKPTGETKA